MNRYGTPLTAGLFAVSIVSGVALFFHWAPRAFHSMHEWLSMILIAPFALHLIKNWKPLLGYAKRKTLLIPLLLSVIVAVPFAWNAGRDRPPNPARLAVPLMSQASIEHLAPVLQSTPQAMLKHLQESGYKATSTAQSPAAIATASAVPAREILASLMPTKRTDPPRQD